MLKALIIKQLLEFFKGYYQNKKTGAIRSKKGILSYIFLFAAIMAVVGVSIFFMGMGMIQGLESVGMTWLYFAFMGLAALALGIFGSIFNTYAGLYKAKDNDVLLSMPIKPGYILLSRMIGVYLMGLLFESIIMVPAVIAYFVFGSPSIWSVIFCILMVLILAVLILALTCLFGWVIAIASSRMKGRNIGIIILSFTGMFLYFFFITRISGIIQQFVMNAVYYGEKIKGAVYPAYVFGRAMEGSPVNMIFTVLAIFIIFGLTYLLLFKTFISIVTKHRGGAKTEYRAKKINAKTVSGALLYKEFKRFTGSTTYFLNAGIGTVFMPALGIMAIVMSEKLRMIILLIDMPKEFIPVVIAVIVCLVASMNFITAPSISLEGKNLWVLRSLPVDTKDIFNAKMSLHRLFTLPSVVAMTVLISFALKLDFEDGFIITIFGAIFVLVSSAFGLFMNLKRPNLDWTNEIIPIKQGASTLFSMLSSWLFCFAFGAAGYMVTRFFGVNSNVIIIVGMIILALFLRLLLRWLYGKGTRIFENL